MSQTAHMEDIAERMELPKTAPADNLPVTMEPHALGVLSRSEIDAQIAKADAKPRNLKIFRQGVRDLAMLNADVAAECTYVIPRDGKDIPGPSIRYAEILAYNFTNFRAGARIIEEAYDHVTAQGFFLDLQNNGVTTFEYSRRITGKSGRRYSADMINTTKNAACAIAKRNAILQAIPKPLWHDIWEETRRFAAGGVDSGFATKVNAAVDAFIKAGVGEDRILAKLGVKSRADIGIDELNRLRGFYTAVRDEEASLEEIFPAPPAASDALDKFAQSAASASAAADSGSGATTAAAADAAPSPPPAASAAIYKEAIDKLLAVATDKTVPAIADRVQILDNSRALWVEKTDLPFVDELVVTAKKVANGDLTAAAARRYLQGIADNRRKE